jgi:DNA polymerase V
MADSLISFLSSSAEKMRRQQLTTNAISVFVETNLFKEKGVYTNSATLKIQPTDSTLELIPFALRILQTIYKPRYGYRKSGVLLLGLTPVEGETKRLFSDEDYQADRELMMTVDALNQKYGRHTVRFGVPVKRMKSWHMNRNHLSPSFTTDINQILSVEM